ncbi:MAG: hypothetical protein Q9210_004037 [Variospora velana]
MDPAKSKPNTYASADHNVDRAVHGLGTLPTWALPGIAGRPASDDEKAAIAISRDERDKEFWQRAKATIMEKSLDFQDMEDEFHGTMPAATGHEPTESEPTESEPAEHEPGDFEINIDPSDLIFDMPEAPQVEVEEKDRGGDALVQTFYEGPARCKCCTNWVEKPPPRIPEATQDRYDQAAIRIYKKKGGTKTYGSILGQRIEEIEIQSPVIIKAIQPLLTEVGMPVHSERHGLLMSSPFKELYFAHSKILNLVQQHEPGSLERTHLDVLAQTLDELFADVSREVSELNFEKRASFQYLWTLFPKDIIVYSRVDGQDRLYQVITSEQYKACIHVGCRYVGFNGVRFGARTNFTIQGFNDYKLVSELPVFPLGFHPDPDLEERLADRGSRVLDFQGTSYRNYNGSAKAAKDDDGEEYDKDDELKSYHVTGRVIIDPFAFEKFEPGCVTVLEKMEGAKERSEAEKSEQSSMSAIFCDLARESRKGLRPTIEAQRLNTTRLRKHRECLCLLSPMLPGFSLKINKWHKSLDSPQRNEIVAVHNILAMFRHLEYYQGIIFLTTTTNLLGSIDEAFLSRTNLHIRFPALSAASRRAIWSNFLGRLHFFDPSSIARDDDPGTQPVATYALDLGPEDLDSLAEWNLNGREIKNIVKNAHLICHYSHLNISLDRLMEAIHITTPFAGKVSPDSGA